MPDSQQQQPLTEQEDWPHKFKLGPDWGTEGAQPGTTATELDSLDKELEKDNMKDVLGDYYEEVESAVQGLIRDNPGLTRSESTEVMVVDPQVETTAKTQDQPRNLSTGVDGTQIYPVPNQKHQFTSNYAQR